MGVLEKLNNIKVLLKDISLDEVPEKVRPEISENLHLIRETINNTGTMVEKYFRDKRNVSTMIKDIRSKMDKIDIYKGLSEKQKSTITDKIISGNDLVLISKDELREFIEDKLKTDSVDNLIKKGYSKKDIMNLGEAVNPPNSNEIVNYDSGFSILQDMVKTPTGREDAITHGIQRLMGDANTLHHYMMLYFGV